MARRLMRLEWSVLALADRDTIFDYIEQDSPSAAITIDERIRTQIAGLAQFPRSGRPGRVAGTRELVIQHTLYIAAYRIAGNTVRILRILHGAQRWPDDLPENPEGHLTPSSRRWTRMVALSLAGVVTPSWRG